MESVDQVLVGGSAAPYAMIKAFDEQHDAFLTHGWGMTEMSPSGNYQYSNQKSNEPANRREISTSNKARLPNVWCGDQDC